MRSSPSAQARSKMVGPLPLRWCTWCKQRPKGDPGRTLNTDDIVLDGEAIAGD